MAVIDADFLDEGTERRGTALLDWTGAPSRAARRAAIAAYRDASKVLREGFGGTPTAAAGIYPVLPINANVFEEIQFRSLSAGARGATISSYLWDFGDGQTSTSQNPTHAYSDDRGFTVSLTINGTSTVTKFGLVTVTGVGLDVDFTWTTADGVDPLAIRFTTVFGSVTSTIVSYDWDFGDAGTSTSQNPTHTYAAPGTYTVTLEVANDLGNVAFVEQEVEVEEAALGVSFTGTPLSGAVSLAVTFDSTVTGGVAPYTYDWDWGDGTGHGSTADPSHNYATPGTYTVTLTVTDSDGRGGILPHRLHYGLLGRQFRPQPARCRRPAARYPARPVRRVVEVDSGRRQLEQHRDLERRRRPDRRR